MTDQEIREAVVKYGHVYEKSKKKSGKPVELSDKNYKGLKTLLDVVKEVLAIKGPGVLPEKKEYGPRCCMCDSEEGAPYCDSCKIANNGVDFWNQAIDETAVKLAKALSGLQKKIGELLYYRICEDGVSINLPPDMPEKFYCNVLAKAITDHIKSKIGINKK